MVYVKGETRRTITLKTHTINELDSLVHYDINGSYNNRILKLIEFYKLHN